MEFFDVYDENRVKTGKTLVRGTKAAIGQFHLVVHVCVFHPDGRMLIQERQPFKRGWSGLWDITVGGAAVAGEDSITAAEREVAEEIGLRISLQGTRPALTVNFDCGFDDIYIIEMAADPSALTLQKEEVRSAKYATKEEIFALLDANKFVPYHKSLISLLFDMRKRRGSHKH